MQQHKKLDDKIKELNSTRVYKKVTPIHDLSWYVKWVSVVFVIIGWMLHSINLFPYNIMIQMIGVAGWLWVGYLWHDRALIVLNSIGVALLGMGLLKFYFGV
jgi:energy-coupling factor transporter transmembrane protein EcfT